MKIERLADLKRIQVGTRLRLVHCLTGPVAPEKQLRTVERVQSNAIVVRVEHNGKDSWLRFPAAKDFKANALGFVVLEGDEIAAQYVVEQA